MQAHSITANNLHSTFFEFEQVTAIASNTARRGIEVAFLSELFFDTLTLLSLEPQGSKESNIETKATAIQRVLNLVAHQSDLTTVICTSLGIALSRLGGDKHNNSEDNDQLLYLLIDLFLQSEANQSTTTSQPKHPFDPLSALAFATSICCGWKVLDLPDKGQSYLSAFQYLTHTLTEASLEPVPTTALHQAILCTIVSSEVSHEI